LVFDHLKKLQPVFKKMYASLKKGGYAVFSVYSPYKDNSFEGPTIVLKERKIVIPTYQHNLTDYFSLMKKFGFELIDIREPAVTAAMKMFYNSPAYKKYYGRPLLLIFKMRKL